MRIAALAAAFGAGVVLTAGALSLEAVRWRFDLVKHKALGRMSGVPWSDLVGSFDAYDPAKNRSLWINSPVRYVRDGHTAPCQVEWTGPLGRFFGDYNAQWDILWVTNKYLGLSADARDGLTPSVEPGDVVLEVGAWIGPFTRYAVSKQAERVIAIEPAPDNAECFRRNFVEELQDGRVTLVEAAAWRSNGEVEMQLAGPNNYYGTTEGYHVVPHGEFTVKAVTIDETVRNLGLERLDVINMDVEGAERHALEGARETIRRFAPQIVVCIHHMPDDAPTILALMQEIRPQYRIRHDGMHARFD